MTRHRQQHQQHGRMVLQHLHQRTSGWCNSTGGVPTPDESQCTFTRELVAEQCQFSELSTIPKPSTGQELQGLSVDINNITAWQLYSRAISDLIKWQVLLLRAHLSALQRFIAMLADATVSQQQRAHLLYGYFVCNYCSVFSPYPQHKMQHFLYFPLIPNRRCSTFFIFLCSARLHNVALSVFSSAAPSAQCSTFCIFLCSGRLYITQCTTAANHNRKL